jgi:hypothetical protein
MSDLAKRIKKIFGPVEEINAHYKLNAIATYYTDTVKVYIPKNPIDKKVSGMELVKDAKALRKIKKQAKGAQSESSSLRRATRTFKDYTKCNNFDLLVTFTFAEDRYDINKCKTKMENWIDNQQDRKGRFEYLIVAELHKDRALHFHALFQGYKGELVPAVNAKTGKPIRSKQNRQVFDIPSYTLGHMDAQKIKDTPLDRAKAARYVGKYLTKEMPLFPGKKRYWNSRGLKTPPREDNPDPWYMDLKPLWPKEDESGLSENEWGKTLIFSRDEVEKAKQKYI